MNSYSTNIKLLLFAFIISTSILSSCKKKDDNPTPTTDNSTTPVADNVTLRTTSMTGENEVPASGSSATGTFAGTYDKTSKTLSYTITYSGITPTGVHIHNGFAGNNGAVEFALATPTASPLTGTTAALTAAQEADLLAGKFYVNMHSAAHANGEIRAQILTDNVVVMHSELSGDQQVPASGSAATGNFYSTYNKSTKILNYTVVYAGTTPTGMHIHNGFAGNNGAVEFALNTPTSSPASGATAALTSAQEADLLAGKLYMNIHSATHPNGDVRAQLATEDVWVFHAMLSGNEEVPASGSSATGMFYGTYNNITNIMSYTVTYTGMTPNGMHIHNAAAGSNGPVEFDLGTPSSSPYSGTTAAFTDTQEHSLTHGNLYVNVHSSTYANGEVRGQID